MAYILTERLRALALAGTELARLQATTLRAKLLEIGAVIVRNSRRVRVMLGSAFAHQAIYLATARALESPQFQPSAVPGTLTNNGGKGAPLPRNQKTPLQTTPTSSQIVKIVRSDHIRTTAKLLVKYAG